jgi:hypothetical protein
MHVNLKTAKALGISISQSILLRADRLIELRARRLLLAAQCVLCTG